jgi:hypothetical protein
LIARFYLDFDPLNDAFVYHDEADHIVGEVRHFRGLPELKRTLFGHTLFLREAVREKDGTLTLWYKP